MIDQHHNQTGIEPLCQALDVPKASFYRSRTRADSKARAVVVPPKHALSEAETQSVLDLLHSERFRDLPPTQVYPILLEEGRYMCSTRTMYRILAKQGEVRERRNVRNHPVYAKPELLATGPNQVWSWDITKLKGPVKWSYYHLYVILDIFSRYVVGWMIAPRESATLAKRLISESCMKQNIPEDQLSYMLIVVRR